MINGDIIRARGSPGRLCRYYPLQGREWSGVTRNDLNRRGRCAGFKQARRGYCGDEYDQVIATPSNVLVVCTAGALEVSAGRKVEKESLGM
jgi:hypothetical protein